MKRLVMFALGFCLLLMLGCPAKVPDTGPTDAAKPTTTQGHGDAQTDAGTSRPADAAASQEPDE